MNGQPPSHNVLSAYFRNYDLLDEIRFALFRYEPFLNEFHYFQDQFKILHRAILKILQTIDEPLQEYIALGLRTSEEGWRNLPQTSQAAVWEVCHMLNALYDLMDTDIIYRQVPGYDALFNIEFNNAISYIQTHFGEEPDDELDFDPLDLEALPQIDMLTVYFATQEDTQRECAICRERYETGQEVRILPCSHRFHKLCVDKWLMNSATCPLDGSNVFEN